MSSNTDVIYLEFPFLHRVVPRVKIQSATVRRWDNDFLQNTSLHSEEHICFVKDICLLDTEGGIVATVGKRTLWEFFKEGGLYQSVGWYNYENVAQALFRLGDRKKLVKYAIMFDGASFTLYKLPKGFLNAADWFLSEVEIAHNQMRQDY